MFTFQTYYGTQPSTHITQSLQYLHHLLHNHSRTICAIIAQPTNPIKETPAFARYVFIF